MIFLSIYFSFTYTVKAKWFIVDLSWTEIGLRLGQRQS